LREEQEDNEWQATREERSDEREATSPKRGLLAVKGKRGEVCLLA